MSDDARPAISVVMLRGERSRHSQMALSRLARQTVVRRMELILVVTSRQAVSPNEDDLRRFLRCRVLEIGAFVSDAEAKAQGVRAASAPLIAFCEDHSYPAHDWAETLIRRHGERDWAAVGPTMNNANPATAASRGCFLVFYGPFSHARASEEVADLPSNNAAYRAELLHALDARLADAMGAESILHAEWTREGRKLCQAPECRAWHMQPSRVWPAMTEYFFSSRLFAFHRAGSWTAARRWLYILLSPGLPLLRARRAFRDGRAAGMSLADTLTSLPPAFAILCAGTAGECLGYAFGAGNAEPMLVRYGPGREGLYSDSDLAAVARL
jgi:hypothetical protein